MKEQLEAVIADLERALENTGDQDRAIVSNIEAPGLMRGAIQALKDIITDGARFTEVPGTSDQVSKLNDTIKVLENAVAENLKDAEKREAEAREIIAVLKETRTVIQNAWSNDGTGPIEGSVQLVDKITALVGPEVDPNAAQAAGANQA